MSTIDIDTSTGLAKRPIRRVSSAEEFRVRAWIELITIRGEWLTNIESGLDYDLIFDGGTDEAIQEDVVARISLLPGFQGIEQLPVITRVTDNPDDGDLNTIGISVTAVAFDQLITVSVGTDITG